MLDEPSASMYTTESSSRLDEGDAPTNFTIKVEDAMDPHHQFSLLERSRRHNMLLPISTLPPEIVCDILRYVAQQRKIQPWEYPPTPTYSWIRVTHVYHYWRVIALSDPQLWNTIGLCAIDFMDELLKRAGNTHLDLTISKPKSTIHISSAVNKIIGALTKARCLRVLRGYVPRKELPQCPEPSQMVLPNLRVLSVFGKPEGFVISMMSKAICPSLTSLRLINMPIPWNNVGLFPTSLTELEIVSIFDPLCRVENALSILARLPNLRFLTISRIGDKKPDRTQSLVQLPYLRELSLTDNCTTISALLGGIVCPASTSLSLQAHYYDQKSDDFRDMLKMILASGPVIQHLFLEIHEVETSMCLLTGLPDLYHTQTYHNFVFQSKNTIDIIHGILNQAPLSNLTSLRWNVRLYSRWTNSCHFPPDVVRFYDSFDKLEALKYLELSGRDSVAVLRHRLKSSSAPVHFPQLQTLKLRDLEEEWYYLARDLAHDFKHLGRCIRKGMLLFPKLCKIVFNKVAGCGEFERRILVDAICLGRSVSTTAVSIEVNKDETRYTYILPDEDAPSSPTHSGDIGTLTS